MPRFYLAITVLSYFEVWSSMVVGSYVAEWMVNLSNVLIQMTQYGEGQFSLS